MKKAYTTKTARPQIGHNNIANQFEGLGLDAKTNKKILKEEPGRCFWKGPLDNFKNPLGST